MSAELRWKNEHMVSWVHPTSEVHYFFSQKTDTALG